MPSARLRACFVRGHLSARMTCGLASFRAPSGRWKRCKCRGGWGSPPLLGMRASPIHVGLRPTLSVWESASCSRCALHPASLASCCHPSAMTEWRSCRLCLEQVSVLRSSGGCRARSVHEAPLSHSSWSRHGLMHALKMWTSQNCERWDLCRSATLPWIFAG